MTAPVVLRSITKVDEMVSVSDAAEAAGELLRMRQSPAGAATYPGQDGDSSPPSLKRQPQSGPQDTNVGTVVSKAKRAASSLWLLLHAQVNQSVTMYYGIDMRVFSYFSLLG